MTQPDFVIRDITDPWKMRELEEVQAFGFGYGDREILPGTMFRISAETGGIVLGAYPGNNPIGHAIGYAYGFPALKNGEVWHHSHMLAIHPQWRGTGLAVALKLAQRERTLQQGLTRMTWTFDPLVARNARLNLGKLGATAFSYHPEWYALGENRETAFPADRLMVEWDLTQSKPEHPAPAPVGQIILQAEKDGQPGTVLNHQNAPKLLAEVPTQELEPVLKLAWRLALREVLSRALAQGYIITDLARDGERAYYVLTTKKGHEVASP